MSKSGRMHCVLHSCREMRNKMLWVKNNTFNLILVFVAIAVLTVFAIFVRVAVAPDTVTVFRSCGITCSNCSEKITRILEKEKGVASSRVDAGSGRVVVWYDSFAVRPEKLARALSGAGFASSIVATVPAVRYSAMTGINPDSANRGMVGTCPGCCRKN